MNEYEKPPLCNLISFLNHQIDNDNPHCNNHRHSNAAPQVVGYSTTMEETALFTKYRLLALSVAMALVTAIAIVACSPAEPQTVQVEGYSGS